ncbi:MAG TPA: M28 family peptidase, partial [Thermoanaerobaculia bacterium]|nr:M28 family peptidase [Thermoanaerobaculia bacterium]
MKPLAFFLALALPAAAQTIDPHAIEAHVRFLASDDLEGRETGTRGFDVAAAYVKAQFDAARMETQLQPMSFRSAAVGEQSMRIGGIDLTPRTDFALQPSFVDATMDLTAPVVFAGQGIVAPEFDHDDYANIDVHGRVVVIVTGAPAEFGIDPRAYYSGSLRKARVAAARGAIGALLVNSEADERRAPFARIAQQASIPSMRAVDPNGHIAGVTSLRVSGRISAATAERLRATPSVTIHLATELANARSANVIGIIRGADERLRNEFVVASAHLDHLGTHDRQGTSDRIYNGAQDNASGIACLIEIARALAKQPPKRSVMFVAFTGEEKGEQGSGFFA